MTNTPTLGATKPGRKSTSVVLIQKLSANSSFTLYDLEPTRLDFNLGTPRSEIPSHYPMVSHSPCDLSDLKQQTQDEATFKQITTALLNSFGVAHKSLQLYTQSLTSIKMIQESLTNKQN